MKSTPDGNAEAEAREMRQRAKEMLRERIRKLHAEGLPTLVISQRVGAGRTVVARALKEMGLKQHRFTEAWPA